LKILAATVLASNPSTAEASVLASLFILFTQVRAASPAVLRSSVNSIKWALLEMDSVPHAPWSGFGSSSRMKRVFDVISSYSEEECPPDVAAAKRQKAQVLPGPVTD
jgi:hypothetical protein